jgi:Cupin-like domain
VITTTCEMDRVDAATFLELLPSLRAHSRPVIVTGLVDGDGLAAASSIDGARVLLGGERVTYSVRYIDIQAERVRRHMRGVPMPREGVARSGTFAEYLELAATDSRSIITEQPALPQLLTGVDLAPLGVRSVVSGTTSPFAEHRPDIAYAPMFVAGPGNASDLHTDLDGRDVLLYQGFGRKRVCVFPPSAGPLLHPVAGFSTVRLAEMTDAERVAFLDYAGGLEALMAPGETVFMPAFVWHHLDYLELSLSVGFRFGGIEDPLARELARAVHIDRHVQRIIAGTRDPALAPACRDAARAVLTAADRRYPSARAKYRAVRAAAAAAAPVGTDEHGRRYLGGLIEAEDFLDGALAGFYSRSPQGPSGYNRLWHAAELARDVVRRRARRVAHWA